MNPVKKKGGIFIKKINIFLIIFFVFFISLSVKAKNTSFYEAEYINGIYMNKYNISEKIIYYQTARFFRNSETNEFAYCLEPFRFFKEQSSYESITPNNLSQEQINLITKIAHFGYGYKDHSDTKWYAITQLMIWQVAEPSGDYYFTDTLKGNRITAYQNEMNEINNLINNYSTLPSFSNKTYDLVEDKTLTLRDENNVLNSYISDNLKIENNEVKLENLKEGTYEYKLIRTDDFYNKPLLFYQSANSQNLVQTGDIENIETKITVNVKKTRLEITKIDKDTQSVIASGKANLDGAIYELFDENNKKIKDLTIKNNQSIVENLEYGNYYLIEKTPGTGYKLDSKKYDFSITKEKTKVDLILENEVIKKKIIVEKKYGEENNLSNENNITFLIFNEKEELIDTITTNELGLAEIILPYGEYKIVQQNTTEGYQKIDPITIQVKDETEEKIECKDLKIPVPNTHTEKEKQIWIILIQILLTII